MPARSLILLLLLPAVAAGVLLAVLGHPGAALVAGLVTFAGSLMALLATRGSVEHQLELLARHTRRRAEGPAAPAPEGGGFVEVEGLQAAIDTLQTRLEAQSAARGQEANILSAVLDSMAEGVWVTDAQGTVVRHNDALSRLLVPGGDMVGQRPLALVRHEPLHTAVLAACHEGRSTELELTLEGLYPRTLAIRVTPLGHALPGSAAVFHDVTELRRLEKVRKDFVANVSHELRTPITAIRGYAETLKGGALGDPAVSQRMVDVIHRQSERLSELVDDLLELSRLEGRALKLNLTRLPLAPAAARAADAVRLKAEGKRVELRLEVPPALHVYADPRAVEQVLLNLLDNAVKYTPEGGRVHVRADADAERCSVRVSDSGLGIEERHLGRIFERFYRVDSGRSRDMGGTGLGLSIVKHLAGAMGGEVQVESRLGQGSTFTVILPVNAPAAAPVG
jgi:two-component system phosphate regulon sensor histidine kinase PhoR